MEKDGGGPPTPLRPRWRWRNGGGWPHAMRKPFSGTNTTFKWHWERREVRPHPLVMRPLRRRALSRRMNRIQTKRKKTRRRDERDVPPRERSPSRHRPNRPMGPYCPPRCRPRCPLLPPPLHHPLPSRRRRRRKEGGGRSPPERGVDRAMRKRIPYPSRTAVFIS